MYESITGQARVTVLTGIPLIDINPDIITEFQRFNKRLIDIFIASLGLLFLIPLNILIGFFIKATTKGEIIYSQIRVGRDGREFILHKFRTMSENSEKESGRIWAVKNDPRITATDTILRRYRLDEIPQLYNVLKGEMSIVGPRPERPHFVKELKEKVLKLINNINIKNVIIKEPLTKKDLINENAKANIGIVSVAVILGSFFTAHIRPLSF